MAVFRFDEVEDYVQDTDGKINFLNLKDDGWYAKVRFMYGPGEMFEGQSVHNVAEQGKMPRYVSCLRQVGQPLESCPLCANGSKVGAQFFIPVFVISIVSVVRGVEQEEMVNRPMIFQKGTTFKGCMQSVVRQTSATNKPIVSSIFRLVRNGKAGDQKTNYSVEIIGTDDVTLEQLPARPVVLGSYILPNPTFEEMNEKYIKGGATQAPTQAAPSITPRTINANTFAGNTVVNSTTPQPAYNQAPTQAPNISGVPF